MEILSKTQPHFRAEEAFVALQRAMLVIRDQGIDIDIPPFRAAKARIGDLVVWCATSVALGDPIAVHVFYRGQSVLDAELFPGICELSDFTAGEWVDLLPILESPAVVHGIVGKYNG